MVPKKNPPPPIAIVGIGLRLPGEISTPEDLWTFLVDKQDARCRVPKDRYNVDAFYDVKPHRQQVSSQYGYFLDNVNFKNFDASFFSMSRPEAEMLDPQQRLLLEVIWECMESAGQTNWRGTNTGCYVGVFGDDWQDLMAKDTQDLTMYRVITNGDFALSNRISYEYNLRGPSMTLRTGCSSSLTGLHEACHALYNGDCTGAIVAGTNLIMSPSMTLSMSDQGVLSPTGSCKTFDAAADGYARGEAVNAVYIKLLDDAIRDGDPIRAVIRSTAINCDGKTPGIACPSAQSHEALMRRAYDVANISDMSQTPYIECHGTGTPIGDPLEALAVANAFGHGETFIGSVKPNLGHSEGASGITSLIKAVLALENRVIPPNIHFSKPNPKIPFQEGKLRVPVEPTPWPKGSNCRVSVNSFGIGGANAHAIVDSAASFGLPLAMDPDMVSEDPDRHDKPRPRLLPVSANNADSLRTRVQDLNRYIQSRPETLDRAAHTLGTRRDHLRHRAFSISTSGEKLGEFDMMHRAADVSPKVAFVFSGQGAQWVGMGRDLIHNWPTFREDIRQMDEDLRCLADGPQWTIEECLLSDDASGFIDKAVFAQPLCTAIQIALVNLLVKFGVTPSIIVGHSSGEIAGAYAAGALTASEAILCGYYRGKATQCRHEAPKGGMAAVGLGQDGIARHLVDGVVVACENSPRSVTLSGEEDALEQTLRAIKAELPSTFTRRLHVDMAYHSHHMQEIGGAYENMLNRHLSGKKATVPFYSTVTGQQVSASTTFDPGYWRRNLESPVLFSTAVQSFLDELHPHGAIFLEIGPHSTLRGPLRQILQTYSGKSCDYVPTMARGCDSTVAILTAAGKLYAHGCAVDFSFINPPAPILTDLPTYPWHHTTELWNEGRISRAWRQKKHLHHELLGSICIETSDLEPVWRNVLRNLEVPWLKDHKVGNNVVFPCAGYIAMIGEALRQITGSEVYTVRNLAINVAMVLSASETIEIMTSMKPSRLSDNASSSWYDFSISSFNGVSWIQHCSAQGKAGEEFKAKRRDLVAYPRHVSEAFWYERLGHLGLNYGPHFQGMREITADTHQPRAMAALRNDVSEHEAKYSVHPVTLDLCLQLLTVAATNGVARRLDGLVVPTAIAVVVVKPCVTTLVAEAISHGKQLGGLVGEVRAVTMANEVAVSLEKAVFSQFETGDEPRQPDGPLATRLQWLPDIDFLAAGDLMRRRCTLDKDKSQLLLAKICALCILRTVDTLSTLPASDDYLAKHALCLRKEKDHIAQGVWNAIVPEAQKWVSLDAEARELLWSSIFNELELEDDDEAFCTGQLFRKMSDHDNVRNVFLGDANPIQLMMEDGGLTSLYNLFGNRIDCHEFFSLCAHAQPNLRVLEIGGGTGRTTADVLEALHSKAGKPMYSEYVFTDISSGFFAAAQERFQDYAALKYQTLDISKDPAEQGFDLGAFDLVVASNVLHATPSLHETLKHVRSLLRPHGRLFLQELSPLCSTCNVLINCIRHLQGFLPGWWLGEADGRPNEPFVSVERWDEELRAAGFSGADAAVLDNEASHQANVSIVATAFEPVTRTTDVTFLYDQEKHEFALQLASTFEEQGIKVHWRKISSQDDDDPGRDVVSTIELEDSYFHNISKSDYDSFMTYISKMKTRMIWLTRQAQIHCTDPRFGLVIGLARSVRTELSLNFNTIELQSLDSVTGDAVLAVFQKLQRPSPSADYDMEQEFAVHDGVIYSNRRRYHWTSAREEVVDASLDNWPKCLTIGRYGLIDTLHWVQHEPTALQADEVEVEMRCIGLNFLDIMMIMGLVGGPKDKVGLEGSGIISRVGSAIHDLAVGDRVMLMDLGCLSTHKVARGSLVVRIPDTLSFEDAATMPAVFTTVIYALLNIAHLARGQSVLIHSACGGVGLAALQICKMVEAETYVTVGNEYKAQHLVDNHGVSRKAIFNSRDVSFLSDVLEATGGHGVDAVLNSLSGELLHASWQCVAKFGKMLEIGKRDIIGRGQLALDVFAQNRSFNGIDLASIAQQRPKEMNGLLRQCMLLYQQGHITPIRPMQIYPVQRLTEALRYMQSGQHMGKLVVAMPDAAKQIPIDHAKRPATLSNTASYLMVGGLGGLGKAVTTWMVERGARSFVFLSRSAGKSADDQAFLRELESQGCRAVAVAGSVVDSADVRRAIQAAPTTIAGVIQMSMVLRDRPFLDMDYHDWRMVQDPKVEGTWNLHKALSAFNLDFFILFSSCSSLYGHPGQANYHSANTFLQSFVQYRHSLNMPCSVIDIGVMEGIGIVSRDAATMNQFRGLSAQMLQEQDLIDALQTSINKSLPPADPGQPRRGYSCLSQLAIGLASSKPLYEPGNRTLWRRDIRMSMYQHLQSATGGPTTSTKDQRLQDLLKSLTTDPEVLHEPASQELVTLEIGRTLCNFTLQPEDSDVKTMTMAAMGIDSLVSIEIRNWWRRTLGVDISILDIVNAETVEQLGKIAIASLQEKYPTK
ncbi:hypothetical protein HIM_03043 [Hirsutella minnesotensis 3608]|nr:hypothetical protein HIM_03043 [Hirsutella minnesotensis 3608]